jgi:hypothetical protein
MGICRPLTSKLVHDAVLAACDSGDGIADGIVSNPVACKKTFEIKSLACAAGQSGDQCLTPAQVKAVQTLHASFKFAARLANGLDDYPGWGISGEATPAFGPTGGWSSWWLGSTPPAQRLDLWQRRDPAHLCTQSKR